MDEERLDGAPESTMLSRLRSVLGDIIGLPLRLLDFHRDRPGKREPMREVRPEKGDSVPDLFREPVSVGMSPSLRKPIS